MTKFLRRKSLSKRGNLKCHILGTEDRRKREFGKVSFQVSQKILRKNPAKIFWLECFFKYCKS